MSLKPICVDCKLFYHPSKNGIEFIEGMPGFASTSNATDWVPYRIWMGDEWRCPKCKSTIIVGVGKKPLAEHYEPQFDEALASLGPNPLQIDDC